MCKNFLIAKLTAKLKGFFYSKIHPVPNCENHVFISITSRIFKQIFKKSISNIKFFTNQVQLYSNCIKIYMYIYINSKKANLSFEYLTITVQ